MRSKRPRYKDMALPSGVVEIDAQGSVQVSVTLLHAVARFAIRSIKEHVEALVPA
jgi:hypothetical protein